MKPPRKSSDIWKAIDDKRLEVKMGKNEWKQSFEGVKSAIEYIGLKMITTKEELDEMEVPVEIPTNRNVRQQYGWRIIEVSRNDILSKSQINDLLTGVNGLKTKEEIQNINTNVGINHSLSRPKGISTTNNTESEAIDDLDILIDISKYAFREHLFEHRLYDISYSMIGDNIDENVFVADQVKSARVYDNTLTFGTSNGKLNVGMIISILENGSLTCIGKDKDDKIDVVWFFYGVDAINILNKFVSSQIFNPTLHLTKKSAREFTNAMNNPMFRFDVGKSSKECDRLLEKKMDFIKTGIKHSLTFLNEDDSQIPCEGHRIEQKSLNMTRSVCNVINIKVERKHEDSYGPVDFIVNGNVRVQDKVGKNIFNVRHEGKLPYNPDDIDIFQVTDLENNIVYAIPMRVMANETVTSFFTVKQLMRYTVWFGIKWKEDHKQFKHDFKTKEGVLSYVKACEEASKVPQLTDRSFYKNMINDNEDKFGSLKQLSDKKNNVQVI